MEVDQNNNYNKSVVELKDTEQLNSTVIDRSKTVVDLIIEESNANDSDKKKEKDNEENLEIENVFELIFEESNANDSDKKKEKDIDLENLEMDFVSAKASRKLNASLIEESEPK